jgi:hypothetical protein
MSIQPAGVVSPARPARLGAALWRAPSVTLARFILDGYIRSGWVWGEVVLVLAQFGALVEFPGNTSYWFDTMGLGLGAQAILGTVVMLRRAFGARAYLPLTRLTSRAAYPRAVALASAVLRVPLFALYLLCILASGRVTNPTPGGILVGAVGLLAGSMVLVAATVLLCPPITTRAGRIVFLIWLVAALASFRYVGPLANVVALVRLPLAPVAASFGFGTMGSIGWAGLGALAGDLVLVVSAIWLAGALLARRDLLEL